MVEIGVEMQLEWAEASSQYQHHTHIYSIKRMGEQNSGGRVK